MASTSSFVTALPVESEREFTTLLIDLYRDCPELWKVRNKNYFNRNKKNEALNKIVGVLRALKPDFTVNKLKQKINVLRTNFNREFKTIEGKKVSVTSLDDVPEPSLWYYKDLYFIKEQMEIPPKKPEPPIPDEDSHSLIVTKEEPISEASSPSSYVASPTSKPALPNSKPSRKWKSEADSTDQLVVLATEYLKRPEAEEDIVAKGWAMKLKTLPLDQKLFAEKIINDTLFEAQMGTLTREGVRFQQPRWSPSPSPPTYPNDSC